MVELVEAGYAARKGRFSVSAAVERDCGRTYASGRMEDIAEEAQNAARMLGRLVERLVDKGVLSADDVLTHILTGTYKVVDGEGGS